VQSIDTLWDAIGNALDYIPDGIIAAAILVLAAALALALHRLLHRLTRRSLAVRYPTAYAIAAKTRGVTRLGLLIAALMVAIPAAPLAPDTASLLARILLIAIIALIGWGAITALNIAAHIYLLRFELDATDNLTARKHTTQIQVLVRTLDIIIGMITVGGALMTFEPVRQYGVSLFASAGVAGIIAGLAARPVLSNLFAGVQLAMTQPIRIDDAVLVENEWGRIEKINATYVVVKLWDWRRMIVPLTYFIEKPFQNWTRESAELIGSVYLYLDYAAPVGAIREKLTEIAKASKLWSGEVVSVQVSDCKDTIIELRALVSARNAGETWDLRCEVREKLIAFLQEEYPQALPRLRAQLAADGATRAAIASMPRRAERA
jgi:small-conductance mechanosensitive channel